MITTEKQRQAIQGYVQDELTKRGFHAPIVNFEEKKRPLPF